MIRKTYGFVLLAAAAMIFGACAESIGDINRVQPNYYSKKSFEGEWYYRQTVTDVPYEVRYLFIGIGSSIERIRWEIQEKNLIAYRVNELVYNANGEPVTGKDETTPVAAWAITSQFDITREYNPGTGEQGNVIYENMSDRPWYERDYIRVDWTRNLIPNQNGLDQFLGFNQFGKATPMLMSGANYWVQDHEEDNPDRFEMSDDYIGVVGRYNVEPDIWTCYLALNNYWGTGTGGNCGPATIKIRSSFMKVKKDRPSYEPLRYDDRRPLLAETDLNGDGKIDELDQIDKKVQICVELENNGNSCAAWADVACNQDILNRMNADPFYGQFNYRIEDCRSAGPEFFEKFGYFRTEHLTYDRDRGLTDSARVSLANRWNIWESSLDEDGKPIPYGQRKVKPVEYYLNADFPEDLFGTVDDIEKQWNLAFKATVAALQGKNIDEVDDVYRIHKNSCSRENLETFVGGNKAAQAIAKRVIGGIDNLTFGNQERLCSALESNLGSEKFTWQKNGDLRYSFVYWVNRPQQVGPLGFGPSYADPDTGELINGTAYVYGAGVDAYAASATDIVEVILGRLSEEQIVGGDSIRENVFRNIRDSSENRYDIGDIPDSFFEGLANRVSGFQELDRSGGVPEILPEQFDARLAMVKGTPLEREFGLNEPMMLAFLPGWKPGDRVSEEQLQSLSASNLFSSTAKQYREKHLLHLTQDNCVMLDAFMDDSIVGLAMEFANAAEEMSREEIYRALREQIFIGVMLHEIGHTVGLRHNFSGSHDALNYFPDFWRYNALDVDAVVAKADPSLDADEVARLESCIARAEDWGIPTPSTLNCLRGTELKQASIMDYGAKFNADFRGLGAYDKAAIAFGYGGLIEVFEDSVQLPSNPLSSLLFSNDYTKIPTFVGGVDNIQARKLVSYDEFNRERAANMVHAAYNLPKFQGGSCSENCDVVTVSREVPYQFCTDSFAGSRLFCDRWDQGASQVEIVQSAVDHFQNYYIFGAFKRGRFNWNMNGYLASMQGRTFPVIYNSYIYYYLYSMNRGYLNLDLVKDLGLASTIGFNLFGEILQSPEAGWACKNQAGDLFLPAEYHGSTCDATTPGSVWVPQGKGRHYWTEYTEDYHYEPSVVPSFLEKVYTIIGMTQSDARYFRVSDGDSSTTSLSFYRVFKDEMLNMLGGIIIDDIPTFSGRVVDVDGQLVYKPRLLVDPETFNRDPLVDNVPPADEGTPILSSRSYDLRYYATLFGMAFLSSNVDATLDFKNYFKVSLKGSVDDIEYVGIDKNDPAQYIEFTEPLTHHTYYAIATADGHSFGYKLIERVKEIYEDPNGGWLARKTELDALTPSDPGYRDAMLNYNNVTQIMLQRLEYLNTVRLFQDAFQFGR